MADRRTPPPLGDLALVGIKAGRQTSERLVGFDQRVSIACRSSVELAATVAAGIY